MQLAPDLDLKRRCLGLNLPGASLVMFKKEQCVAFVVVVVASQPENQLSSQSFGFCCCVNCHINKNLKGIVHPKM